MRNEKGQLLVGAILLLLILAVLVPTMVMYVQREANWSVKQGQNSNAFQLAEAAVDRGYQKVTESTQTWVAIQNGTAQTGFKFDTAYTDLGGGSYAISVTSGPGAQVVTIIGVGRDKYKKEVRALQVVYTNSPLGGAAIQSGTSVTLGGTNEVEWGSVVSAQSITLPAGVNHPQFYSAGEITGKHSGGASALPTTDSIQWWAFYPNIPPAPYIDFDFYLSSAIATGTCISEVTTGRYAGCVNSGINSCDPTGWSGGGDHDCGSGPTSKACKGYTWYINCPTNGITINQSDNTWIQSGNIIVIGDLTVQASAASGIPTANLPQTAWKQYGNDWSFYLTNYGNSCTPPEPASFPGLTSTHLSPANCTYSNGTYFKNVLNHGFLYVSGNATFQSGGTTEVWGGAYIAGTVNVAPGGYVVYSDPAVSQNLATTRILLTRTSWQGILRGWPSGLP